MDIQQIIERIEEYINDPASWHNNKQECEKEMEDLINAYAKQFEGGGSGLQKL